MVCTDGLTAYKSSGLVLGRRPLGAVLHSSNEPGELSRWLCHDDSTINVVLDIIIIIIIIIIRKPDCSRSFSFSWYAVCLCYTVSMPTMSYQ